MNRVGRSAARNNRAEWDGDLQVTPFIKASRVWGPPEAIVFFRVRAHYVQGMETSNRCNLYVRNSELRSNGLNKFISKRVTISINMVTNTNLFNGLD